MFTLFDPQAAALSEAPTSPWRTQMEAGPVFEGGHSYSADIYRGKTVLCRLVFVGAGSDPAAACAVLEARALDWIASYEGREPHRGPSLA